MKWDEFINGIDFFSDEEPFQYLIEHFAKRTGYFLNLFNKTKEENQRLNLVSNMSQIRVEIDNSISWYEEKLSEYEKNVFSIYLKNGIQDSAVESIKKQWKSISNKIIDGESIFYSDLKIHKELFERYELEVWNTARLNQLQYHINKYLSFSIDLSKRLDDKLALEYTLRQVFALDQFTENLDITLFENIDNEEKLKKLDKFTKGHIHRKEQILEKWHDLRPMFKTDTETFEELFKWYSDKTGKDNLTIDTVRQYRGLK